MKWWGMTDVGKVRGNNEDAYIVVPELNTAIVADGLGGASCGEVASEMTIETVTGFLRDPDEEFDGKEAMVKEAIRRANTAVWEEAKRNQERHGMGSTIVMALWSGEQVLIANVGDSRAYLYRKKEMRQLSYDQSIGNELRNNLGLTDEQIRQVPHFRALTMAIGTAEEVLVRTHTEPLCEGDQILLCSDGLYGPVSDKRIAEVLASADDVKTKVETYVRLALEGGGPDNVTVILLQY